MTKYVITGKAKVIPDWVVDPDDLPIEIAFKCPMCGDLIRTLWLYPSTDMEFTTDCCGVTVFFEGRGDRNE
jgi:hypothetical protein